MQLENGAAMYIGHRNQIYLFTNQSGEMCWVILRQGKRGQFGNSYEPEHCKQQALEFAREHLGPSEADVLHLMELTPADRVSRVPLLDLDCLKTWYRGRCVVIGDAAHATTPFVGRMFVAITSLLECRINHCNRTRSEYGHRRRGDFGAPAESLP